MSFRRTVGRRKKLARLRAIFPFIPMLAKYAEHRGHWSEIRLTGFDQKPEKPVDRLVNRS